MNEKEFNLPNNWFTENNEKVLEYLKYTRNVGDIAHCGKLYSDYKHIGVIDNTLVKEDNQIYGFSMVNTINPKYIISHEEIIQELQNNYGLILVYITQEDFIKYIYTPFKDKLSNINNIFNKDKIEINDIYNFINDSK